MAMFKGKGKGKKQKEKGEGEATATAKPSTGMVSELQEYFRARYPGIAVRTSEPKRAIGEIMVAAEGMYKDIMIYDPTIGLLDRAKLEHAVANAEANNQSLAEIKLRDLAEDNHHTALRNDIGDPAARLGIPGWVSCAVGSQQRGKPP